MVAIDHLAFPCFDVAKTVSFYTELLGATLRHAQSGPAEEWRVSEYLLLAFELPGGVVLDFFSFDGIRRPAADGLPKDIRHVGLTVASRDEVHAARVRFERAGVPLWIETHAQDDVHVYVTDPNGIVLEIMATEDGVGGRAPDPEATRSVVERWLSRYGGRS
jgi:catechol 2,3-dioxygenase-like lactoylglutathione lyase family enzyme